jgi:hypothetical protein
MPAVRCKPMNRVSWNKPHESSLSGASNPSMEERIWRELPYQPPRRCYFRSRPSAPERRTPPPGPWARALVRAGGRRFSFPTTCTRQRRRPCGRTAKSSPLRCSPRSSPTQRPATASGSCSYCRTAVSTRISPPELPFGNFDATPNALVGDRSGSLPMRDKPPPSGAPLTALETQTRR